MIKCPQLFILLGFFILFSFRVNADYPEGYYQSVEGKSGNDLINTLHDAIDGHTVLPYTSSGNTDWYDGEMMDVWEALAYTDAACPPSSPQCGYVQMLYLEDIRPLSKANRGSGKPDLWEREHVWPKSRGFPNKNQVGYTDLHHLRPADRNLNGRHNNYGYDMGGEVVMDELADGTLVPTEARLDKDAESFEPTNRAKGQVARMVFYMAVRYGPGDDGPDEAMPDLVLKDENARKKEAWIGDLCTLLDWHNRYGVTDFERRRNDRVMELQGNRNPFIDEPGWANLIWMDKCN